MSDKIKIAEIAEESGSTPNQIIKKAQDLGMDLKATSAISIEDADEIIKYILTGKSSLLIQKEKKKTSTKISTEKNPEQAINPKKIQENLLGNNQTNLATPQQEENTIIPLRRGLKIVKKNNTEQSQEIITSQEIKKTNTASLSELFSINETDETAQEKINKNKPKKEKKKILHKAAEHGQIIEVYNDDNFKNSDDFINETEVVLIDLGGEVEKRFEETEDARRDKVNAKSTRIAQAFTQPTTLRRRSRKKQSRKNFKEDANISSIVIPEEIRVYELAEKCNKTISEVMSKLFELGLMVTKNDFLDKDAIEILAEEFNINITIKDMLDELDYITAYDLEFGNSDQFDTKPPVITIMGHVDHGKTSLLDKIRNSQVASTEAGGITQHIGAYTIIKNNQKITFLDTPGHEAFTAMRARGASFTDIIIIVVAADDGVKPQTKEAIEHAKNSGAPIIVAITKIDKENANPDLVKTQMAENGMLSIDWGGEIEFIEVSSYTGSGIDNLLEHILIQAEILELKANKSAKAKCVVIESSLEKGKGPVATVIVQNGTLHLGEMVLVDTTFGRIKAINNDRMISLKELHIGETGQILGLNEVPSAGTILVTTNNEKNAREIAQKRAEYARQKELSKSTKVSLEELGEMVAEGKLKTLPVIIKADVAGSLEAIKTSLEKLRNDEVKVNVINAAVGGITENDLKLANTSANTMILGFNVRPTGIVKEKAKEQNIQINTYRVIYDLLDDIRGVLAGMMSAVTREENTGQAVIRDLFHVPKIGTIAGCFVSDGKVIKGGLARVIRDGIVVHATTISSLKRFKDDAKEVTKGFECGIMLEGFNDLKVGDYIETFIEIKEKVTISAV